jgi:hypothetical protein
MATTKVTVQVPTKDQLVAALTEWERRYREEPDRFMSDQERIAETAETLGEQRAVYLIELLTQGT